MNSVAAGLAAGLTFVASVCLAALFEMGIQDTAQWGDFDPTSILDWQTGGLGIAAAAAVFRLTLGWRRKAAAKARRKQIAARARA